MRKAKLSKTKREVGLTPKEKEKKGKELFRELTKWKTTEEIAELLGISIEKVLQYKEECSII